MSNNTNTLVGLLAGTVVGAAIGILFAPDSGVRTRKRIADKASDVGHTIADKATHMKDVVVDAASSKKETLEAQVESIVSDVSHKTDDVISTLEKKLAELKAKNKKYQK